MSLLDLSKLEKLKIEVYTDRARTSSAGDPFEVMFNPSSFSMKHGNEFQQPKGITAGAPPANFAHGQSQELSLEFQLDGNGVTDFGIETLFGFGTDSVPDQIAKFKELCIDPDPEIHEPWFLRIVWGTGPLQAFDCRLKTAEIRYTSFEKNGAPLAAEISAVFVEDSDPERAANALPLSSPDLSHRRVVKAGDTLTLLCKEIYGSPKHYLFVAESNELDDFRNLSPGQTLLFPPLTS